MHFEEDGTFTEDFEGLTDFRVGKYEVEGDIVRLIGDDGNTDEGKVIGSGDDTSSSSTSAPHEAVVRLVIARCQVDYAGRLTAHLPLATRVIMVKNDGSVLIHSDGGSYKPLNWMSPPCTLREGVADDGVPEWTVSATKTDDTLRIRLEEIMHDSSHDLGVDPGLQKDGVEKHLQELLAEHTTALGSGMSLVRREYMTAIGPVDLLCKDAANSSVAVEIKRRGDIDGVEQLTRYLELMNRDPALRPVRGIFAAQEIKPQARVLAEDRGITCVVVNYDELRGIDDPPASVLSLRRA